MNDIRLVGLAGPSDGTNREKIEGLTGYRLVRDGNDWIIPAHDPGLAKGPSDILRTNDEPWALTANSFERIAEEYETNHLIDYFEQRLEQPKKSIPLFAEFGIRTDIEQHRLHFFFTPRNLLKKRLIEEIFPFAVDKLRASSVAPLTVDAQSQQFILSVAKILVYFEEGGQELAEKRVQQGNVLEAVLPTPIHLMSYVDALNTMCPSATSLSLSRVASSLHFMRGRPWFFPRVAIENVFEQLLGTQEALSDERVAYFLQGQHFQRRAIHSYFLSSVRGINRLARFLNDIRTYVDQTGKFDGLKLIKAHSVIRLLFLDWLTANFTQSRYVKLRLAFSFLDKLSNFVCFMRNSRIAEEELFHRLCSSRMGDQLGDLLGKNFGTHYHALGRVMSEATKSTYTTIHKHVAAELGRPGKSEQPRLAYIRTLRNTTHGTFLNARRFEQVFMASAGTLPGQFMFLPLLLLWGLIANPRKFIDMV